MMGQAVGQQDRLFYEFNPETRVPAEKRRGQVLFFAFMDILDGY